MCQALVVQCDNGVDIVSSGTQRHMGKFHSDILMYACSSVQNKYYYRTYIGLKSHSAQMTL